jgi:hypothetical protein
VVTDVPLLRSKQEEHFLSSSSSFFPLLSRNPTGTLAGFRSQTRSSHGIFCLMDGRNCTHLRAVAVAIWAFSDILNSCRQERDEIRTIPAGSVL